MSVVKQTILRALAEYRGDNLYRARARFRDCTPEQMQQEYGQSGETRAAILAGYEEHETRVLAAIAEVERVFA